MSDNLNQKEPTQDLYFFDYILILLKWRKVLIAVFLVASIASITVAMLLTKKYTSTVTVMAPKTPDLLSMMGGGGRSALQRLAASSLLGGMSNMGGYNFLAVLGSRTVLEDAIAEFNLREHYKMEDREWERVLERFNDNVSVSVDRNEFISITVEDEDPELAAKIATFLVQRLNARSIEMGVLEAKLNKEFVESRVLDTRQRLLEAEKSLQEHFTETEILVVPEQGMSSMSAIAELYAVKMEKEIELAFLRNTVAPNDRMIRQAELEFSILQERVNAIPEASVESIRRYREVVILQSLLEFLVPVLEQSRLEEQRNIPVIVVLDEAKVAEKKSKPLRTVIVLVTVILSMLVTVTTILIRERLTRVLDHDPEQKRKVEAIQKEIKVIFSKSS